MITDNSNTSHQAENIPDQPVLVAIDFSDDARAALLWACQFADCVAARLILLHVVHDLTSKPGFYRSEEQDTMQPLQAVAELMMAEFLDDVIKDHPGLDVLKSADTRFIGGLPPGRIVEVADLLDAKIIVIGSRGMTGLPHLMLGSVAERVVELSDRPVVVVKAKNRSISKKQQKKLKKARKLLKLKMEEQGNAGG